MKTFVEQRSFEISWAVFRVAALMRHSRLKAELENAAIELVTNLGVPEIGKLERLVRLGESAKEIASIDASVLYRELGNLEAAILRQAQDESGKILERESADIESIFAKLPMVVEKVRKSEKPSSIVINAAMRQTAILEKMRQLPECRMKDLIAVFPEVSERTLRNDLQRLTEQGLIERVGNGGPNSFYRSKTSENLVTPQ